MTLTLPVIRPIHIAFALLIALLGGLLIAQIEGERGIAPIASSGDFEVRDIKVDVYGADADAARQAGWKLAQRLGWRALWQRTNGGAGAMLPDGALDSIVSGIEVQREEIGPNRYIATLAIFFDRARAGQIMGVSGQVMRSPPLLVIPVLTEGGTSTTFETPTEWQRAWALFRTADSAIDYVRTTGDRADPMLLNAAQTRRRGRNWWRTLLDQYGAADVIMPMARLDRTYPGGPVIGRFAARYGPDSAYIGSFTLRVEKSVDIPQMMNAAVKKMDELYTQALISGMLRPDPSLIVEEPVDPATLTNVSELGDLDSILPSDESVGAGSTIYSVQFDTPTAASVSQGESSVRGIPGVRSAATSSLALGGVSVMDVTFAGPADQLRAALEARGYAVSLSGTTLRIVRRATPAAPPLSPGADSHPGDTAKMTQLALPIDWQRRGGGDRPLLLSEANASAITLLRDWKRWPGPAAILAGPRKSGRSILGRIFAGESGARVIDDSQGVHEETLFHAWNDAQTTGQPLLLIAENAPPAWAITLPDLRTRLATAATAHILPPDEALIADLVAQDLARMGAAFAPDVPGYVARRCERCYLAVHQIIDSLNALSVSRNCKISVALAGEILAAGDSAASQ